MELLRLKSEEGDFAQCLNEVARNREGLGWHMNPLDMLEQPFARENQSG